MFGGNPQDSSRGRDDDARQCPRYPSFAECHLRYNLSDSEREGDERLHQTEPDVPPIADSIDDSEYRRITDAIAPVIERHNRKHGFTQQSNDYYYLMAEQSAAIERSRWQLYGLAEYTVELTLDLQEVLRGELRLWRILLESNAIDDLVLVYPDTVRNNDAIPGEHLEKTLARVNEHSKRWGRLFCRYMINDAPGYQQPSAPPRLCEMKVAYNASSDECDLNCPRFNTIADPPELTTDEYLEIEKDLVPALERYGPVITKNESSDLTKEKLHALWLLRTAWMQWDRTRILVKYGNQEFSDAMIRDIQFALHAGHYGALRWTPTTSAMCGSFTQTPFDKTGLCSATRTQQPACNTPTATNEAVFSFCTLFCIDCTPCVRLTFERTRYLPGLHCEGISRARCRSGQTLRQWAFFVNVAGARVELSPRDWRAGDGGWAPLDPAVRARKAYQVAFARSVRCV